MNVQQTMSTIAYSPAINQKRVVVAMSGGVDSSVAAALLSQQGYDVIGMMMRLWSEPESNVKKLAYNRCCTPDQIADARRVAQTLNIPFYVIDAQTVFYRNVVEPFVEQSQLGMTPNPCIECNRTIRFNFLLQHALLLGAEYLVTGHYAQIKKVDGEYQLFRARDYEKDQSYVLHVLGQEELAHTLLPIGSYSKNEIRHLAKKFHLDVAQKSESMDLCFVADGDHRRFISSYSAQSQISGPIETVYGEVVGHHSGLAGYTIGQRKGLGIALGIPVFVIRKDTRRNALIVGPRDKAYQSLLVAEGVTWVSGNPPDEPIQAQIKIRYRAHSVPATITPITEQSVKVNFQEPVFGITAGQGAVFYDDDRCLGGGIIGNLEEK